MKSRRLVAERLVKKTNTTKEKLEISWSGMKAHFILQGSTLAEWCREHDTDVSNMKKIFDGKWTGPRATTLLKKLNAELDTKAAA